MSELIKEGDVVSAILVTGEKATGIYSCQKPTSKSHLITNVSTECGQQAEYAWAESVSKK